MLITKSHVQAHSQINSPYPALSSTAERQQLASQPAASQPASQPQPDSVRQLQMCLQANLTAAALQQGLANAHSAAASCTTHAAFKHQQPLQPE
jgi:hypothetical protein